MRPEQVENLISRIIHKVYFKDSVKSYDLWEILEDLIDDEIKLNMISREIPEFADFYTGLYNNIN